MDIPSLENYIHLLESRLAALESWATTSFLTPRRFVRRGVGGSSAAASLLETPPTSLPQSRMIGSPQRAMPRQFARRSRPYPNVSRGTRQPRADEAEPAGPSTSVNGLTYHASDWSDLFGNEDAGPSTNGPSTIGSGWYFHE